MEQIIDNYAIARCGRGFLIERRLMEDEYYSADPENAVV